MPIIGSFGAGSKGGFGRGGKKQYEASYLVIAGGGGSGASAPGPATTNGGGGGGAGGYRNSYASETSGRNSPTESKLTFTGGRTYTIAIGGGGSGGVGTTTRGTPGSVSSLSGPDITTITSVGGGVGGNGNSNNIPPAQQDLAAPGDPGGSGGASGAVNAATRTKGSGTANQGFDGGNGTDSTNGQGASGGGAGGAGTDGVFNQPFAIPITGGLGLSSLITGTPATRAVGGGYNGSSPTNPGTANTGNGAGAAQSPTNGDIGGSGVVIIRVPDADYSGVTTGSPTVTTGVGGTDTVLVFTGPGTYKG